MYYWENARSSMTSISFTGFFFIISQSEAFCLRRRVPHFKYMNFHIFTSAGILRICLRVLTT